ncbi:MAG: hypothetical protein U5R31_02705 [Acidimicrobiia bacterium]|nr:hypothetical protein [Acidimicrobiia bacterium]
MPSAATPRTLAVRAAAHVATAPPVPNPASHRPLSDWLAEKAPMADSRSSTQPASEKSPGDRPHPRKLKVSTDQPISVAIRSASSGKLDASAALASRLEGKP